MKKNLEHIDDALCLKIVEKRANVTEIDLFENWLGESVMHAEYFEQFKKAYQLTSIDDNARQKNWESVVEKVKSGQTVPDYITLPAKQTNAKTVFMRSWIRVAASLVILFGIGFLLKMIVFDSGQLIISGKDLHPKEPFQLSDGSLVYLNENSEIAFSKKFGKRERNIALKGEAFFEVKRNEKIPFQISTGNTTTHVLGTKFNVYSDSVGNVKVSVVSGVVAFYSGKKDNGVKLIAGEQAVYNPNLSKVVKEQNSDPNFLSWKTGILYFKDTPITDAFRLLQKQYSRVFVFDPKEKGYPTVTTTFDNQPLEAVLEELNLLLNTKNFIQNDTIFFETNH
jgi:ferric-dicitrate binding protein FerR (iron transport regulator)